MNPDSSALGHELADAIARDDLRRLAEIVDSNLWVLVQAHWPALVRALEHLPEAFFQTRPAVDLVRGFGASVFLESGQVNARAVAMASAGDSAALPDRVLDAILLHEMLAHRLRADFASALATAARLRARVERNDGSGHRPIHEMASFYLLHVGITTALSGDLDQALRDFANVRSLHPAAGAPLAEYDVALKSAVVLAALGRLTEAERTLRSAGAPPELSDPFASQLAATADAVRALVAVDRLSSDAPELVAKAVDSNADTEMWPFALLAATRWSIATGDLVGALDQVDRAVAARPVPRDSLFGHILYLTRAKALAIMGEVGPALRALELDESGDAPPAAVVRARLALYTDGAEAALIAARRMVVQPGLGPALRAETMLVAAWAQTRLLGVPDAATAGPLGALIAREGLWRILQLAPERVAEQIPGTEGAPAFERRIVHAEPSTSNRLTANELEVLELLAGPESLPQIAKRRFVSPNTIKTQVASIYRRLGVHGRQEAVAEAMRRGILTRSLI
ncbi:MAG TPA: LuxR C-terminal-related transcriptional regulator [Microbacteriaceae bacterium]|nr:LuxR C-terminal-related transcriptional regulator [Microbacteriaceae bacterium]